MTVNSLQLHNHKTANMLNKVSYVTCASGYGTI